MRPEFPNSSLRHFRCVTNNTPLDPVLTFGISKNSPSQKDAAPDSVFFTEQLCHEREEAGSLLRTGPSHFSNAAPARRKGRSALAAHGPSHFSNAAPARIGAFVWYQKAVQSLGPRQNRSRAIVQFSRSDTIFRGTHLWEQYRLPSVHLEFPPFVVQGEIPRHPGSAGARKICLQPLCIRLHLLCGALMA